MAKNNLFASVLRGCAKFFATTGKLVWGLGKFLFLFTQKILAFAGAVLLYLLVFNPVMFWLWAFIWPKAADFWKNFSLNHYFGCFRMMDRTVYRRLPYRRQKAFLKLLYPLHEFSVKFQLKYYAEQMKTFSENRSQLLKKMSHEAINKLWDQLAKAEESSETSFFEDVVLTGSTLTKKQIDDLLDLFHKNMDAGKIADIFCNYICRYTPSKELLHGFAQRIVAGQKSFLKPLRMSIWLYGLPSDLVVLFANLQPIVREEVLKELRLFSLKTEFKKLTAEKDADGFRRLVRKQDELPPALQKMMALWQYDIYHNCHRHLDKEVILFFLRQEQPEFWMRIFRYEATLLDEPVIMATIQANPRLNNAYLDAKK